MKPNLRFARGTLLLPPKPKLIILNIEWILAFITIDQHIIQSTTSLTFSIRCCYPFGVIIVQSTAIGTHYILKLAGTVLTFLILAQTKILGIDRFTTIRAWDKISHLFAMCTFYFLADLLGLEVVGWLETLWTSCIYNILGTLLTKIFMHSFIDYLVSIMIDLSSTLTHNKLKFLLAMVTRS